MVEQSIVEIVKRYLRALNERGLPAPKGIIFGSQAKGTPHAWSDIDLLVISPLFGQYTRRYIDMLWHTTRTVDSRIEPIAVGEQRWLEDDTSPIIEIARREGEVVSL
jgi:predicted nucleotidyltransferase